MKKFETPVIKISLFDTSIRTAAESSSVTQPVAAVAAQDFLTEKGIDSSKTFEFIF